MRPFGEAVEEADITVCFHIGENIQGLHRGGTGTFLLQSFMPFRKIVGELVFGGVLDRHPSLRIMFAEAGINWLASTLQDVKMIRSEEHTSELQSLMRISYAVFCLKKKKQQYHN